ncbi:MAG: hypothetical protein CUN56_00610 [Phototrophicales bacterium]|nr:MAG: hypothetical protein CUN56_00610 [Phototrophicales bacterium]
MTTENIVSNTDPVKSAPDGEGTPRRVVWFLANRGLLYPEVGDSFVPLVHGKEHDEIIVEPGQSQSIDFLTSDGISIAVHADHEVLMFSSGGRKWIKASDIKSGDFLCLSNNAIVEWDVEDRSIEKELDMSTSIFKDALPPVSSDYIRRYLRYLFDSYGRIESCILESDPRYISLQIILSAAGVRTAGGSDIVQQLLLSLGVFSHQVAKKNAAEVVIYGPVVRIFAQRIGFAETSKLARLARFVAVLPSTPLEEQFLSRVVSVRKPTVLPARLSGRPGSVYTVNGLVARLPSALPAT